MNCGIYNIRNIINNKIYIGSSENLKKRLKDHLKELRANRHANNKLQNAWKKYGEQSFLFEVILFCDKLDLIPNEQMFLDSYAIDQIYNICLKAGNTKGYKHSKDTKRKIGESSRGNKNCLGKKLSKEHREKIRAKLFSRPVKNETKKKISEAKKGRKNSEEHNKKVSAGLKKFYLETKEVREMKGKKEGKKWTQEQKDRHSQIMRSPEVTLKLKSRPKRITSEETKKKLRTSMALLVEKNRLEGKVKVNSESTRQKIKNKLSSPETQSLLKQRWVERKQKQNTENK
jgi:group I intron endonuclease